MKIKQVLIPLIAFFFCQQAFSQTTLTIEILDGQTGQPLANASIQLLDPTDGGVLHFGFTDKEGSRTFANVRRDSLLAKVSFLGYVSAERRVRANGQKYTFRLEQDEIKVEEITITEYPRSFIVKEDTISYKLKNTVDGTERNLGEALNKLPGIEVDEKGIVSHQGRKIEKILVDGNDFFGNKHQMSTQNLRVDMVDEVDLISNYTDNPLEERGGKTVLNLRMNEEFKHRFL